MTSKERVLSVFSGKSLDCLPMWYGGDPRTTQNIMNYLGVKTEDEALDKLGIDFRTLRPRYIGPELKMYADGSADTFWGVRRGGYHYGQALTHPLRDAECIRDIESYKWPELDWWDVKLSKEDMEKYKDYGIIGGMWSPFFHDALEIVGMEKFMIDMYFNSGIVEALISRVFDYYYVLSEKVFVENLEKIDMFFFGNDFGTQRSLMISPEMWRKFFKPCIRKFVELGHRYDIVTALHSCGDIHEILPDLIEIGLDAINPIQVNAEYMDPAVLKKEYGKDIVFFGGIDENVILATGTETEVRNETKRIIDILGSDGKYIVAASHDYLLPEIPAENICAMFHEARKYSCTLNLKKTIL